MTRQFATDQFVGGNQDQVFTKNSGADFDMGWKDPTGGGGGEGGHKIHTTRESAEQTVVGGTTKYGFSDFSLDDHNAGVTVEVGDYIVSTSGRHPFGRVTGNTYIMTVTGILDINEDLKFYTISDQDYLNPYILTETGKWTPFNCSGTTTLEDVKVTKTSETFADGASPSVTRVVGSETVSLRDIPTPGSSDDNYAFNEILKTELWTRLISVHQEGVSGEGGAEIGMHTYELYDVAIQAGSVQTRYATEAEAIFTITTSIIGTLDPDDDEYATTATSVNGAAPTIVNGTPFEVKIPLGKNAYILRHKYENYVDPEENDDSWYIIINNFTYTESYPSISGSDMIKNTYTGYAKFYLWK